jgi:translation initiation factor IF-1
VGLIWKSCNHYNRRAVSLRSQRFLQLNAVLRPVFAAYGLNARRFAAERNCRCRDSAPRANGHQLVAYTAGRMKRNRIKTLAEDRVTVEVSPYDLEKGRLIFRHKDERTGSLSRPQRYPFRRR